MPRISEIVLREVADAQFILGGVGELEKLGKLVNINHFKFLGFFKSEETYHSIPSINPSSNPSSHPP